MLKKLPFALALLSIVGGVFISILFAVNEDLFKSRISSGLDKNIKIQQIADPQVKEDKIKSESEKNWRYYQRFHFHATGIGAMMMGILLFLSRLRAPKKHKSIASYLIAVGGFLYPFVWLFAGIYGPEMGRSEAKEAFAVFGYMGGLFLLGGIYSTILALRYDLHENV
jgi:hypothetical protein